MQIPVQEYLDRLLASDLVDSGELAQYIPELAQADPNRLAIAFATPDGQVYSAGDTHTDFSIQSISKPFTYAQAIIDVGIEKVLEHIDVEPSGDAFNELSLDPATGRPFNPMINAGAITAHGLVTGTNAEERTARLLGLYSRLAGRELRVDENVYRSELADAHRNTGLAYMLRATGAVECEPQDVVDGYTRQCSILVTVEDLARMAAALACGGRTPDGDQVIPTTVTRQVLSVMTTCGMYDSAGDWLTGVGIPAKSGVAGGILGVLPGQLGLATFSPRLDEHGNSSRGVALFERLNKHMDLHLMDTSTVTGSVVRRHWVQGVPVHEVNGDLRFVEVERVMRSFASEPVTDSPVVLDLSRVSRSNDIARRVLLEGIRRLHLDGHDVRIIDPAEVLGVAETGNGEIVLGQSPSGGYVPRRYLDLVDAVTR